MQGPCGVSETLSPLMFDDVNGNGSVATTLPLACSVLDGHCQRCVKEALAESVMHVYIARHLAIAAASMHTACTKLFVFL